MSTKHTPGPWRASDYVPNKRTNRTQSIIWGQQVSPLATVENGPREANAALIAAAPELLAALEQVAFCADVEVRLKNDAWVPVLAMVKAAIAKAEGGAQ